MTKKEERHVRNLEIKVEELERHLKLSQRASIENFTSAYDSRIAMRQAYEALLDAAKILEDCMREDPAFIKEQAQRRAEIVPNF